MLVTLSGDYFAAAVKMLLASPKVRACLIGPDEITRLRYTGVKNVVIHDDYAREKCIAILIDSKTMRVGSASSIDAYPQNYYLAYPGRDKSVDDSGRQEVQIMAASEFVHTVNRISHLNLSSWMWQRSSSRGHPPLAISFL